MIKKILVTGGAGFVGSNLCEYLVKNENNFVIALDDLSTGNIKNLNSLLKLKNFKFIEHNIQNPIDIEVNEIYNAACPASPPSYQKSPTNTIKTCVLGMLNMLELAKKYNAKIMQFSTSEVYGEPLEFPQRETYRGNVNPIGIRGCYDEGKRCAETLCFDYYREFNVKIKIIRIFNTYGKNMDKKDGRVVSNFINQALNNEDITIYGDGTQTRSFQYIDDLIEGIIRTMNDTDDNFLGPINLGNPEEFTMLQLANEIINLTNSKSNIVYLPLPEDDPTKRKPDISLAYKTLNKWTPEIKLHDGLIKTIEYFKNL